MKQKLPTILILLVMALMGAMYWIDLTFYTDPTSGFITHGSIWLRYLLLLVPVLMCLLGLRTIGPRAISVMRTRNRPLGGVFAAAGIVGAAYGVMLTLVSISPPQVFNLVVGVLFIWYGVWMFLVALQFFNQTSVSPTRSAIFGVFAAVPISLITIYRILVRPSTLFRVGPLAKALAALLAMLWFGLLLRSLYIAMPRRRVRWIYIAGVFTFLFATCLELPYTLFNFIFAQGTPLELMESLNMAMLGLTAGCLSVAIAGRSVPAAEPEPAEAQGSPA